MKRLATALFVAGLLGAPAAWADDDHGRHHGHGHSKHEWKHDKHEWKHWKHAQKHWRKQHRWDDGYYYHYQQPPVVQQQQYYYYQPAPAVVYQPRPVYQPYYAGPPEVNLSFRLPLN